MSSASETRGFNFDNRYFHFVGDAGGGSIAGEGVLYFSDGGSLEGNFVQGELTGPGVRRWEDGSTYMGEFRRGEPHGQGRIVLLRGEEYEGGWQFGQRSGYGKLIDRSCITTNTTYVGEFAGHRFDGKGHLKTNEFTADGNFRKGKPHGEIEMRYVNGDTAKGNAVNGVLEGEAVLHFADGDVTYEGPVQGGKRTVFPSSMRLTKVEVLSYTDTATTLNPGNDGFVTMPQWRAFRLSAEICRDVVKEVQLQPTTTGKESKLSKLASKATGKQSSTIQNLIKTTIETVPCEAESGRIGKLGLYKVKGYEGGKPVVDSSNPLPLGAQGVTAARVSAAVQQIKGTPTATPQSHPITPMARLASPSHKNAAKRRSSAVLHEEENQKQLLDEVPHVFHMDVIGHRDAYTVEVVPVLFDPCDIVAKITLDFPKEGCREVPGDLSPVKPLRTTHFEVSQPIHLVRQC